MIMKHRSSDPLFDAALTAATLHRDSALMRIVCDTGRPFSLGGGSEARPTYPTSRRDDRAKLVRAMKE